MAKARGKTTKKQQQSQERYEPPPVTYPDEGPSPEQQAQIQQFIDLINSRSGESTYLPQVNSGEVSRGQELQDRMLAPKYRQYLPNVASNAGSPPGMSPNYEAQMQTGFGYEAEPPTLPWKPQWEETPDLGDYTPASSRAFGTSRRRGGSSQSPQVRGVPRPQAIGTPSAPGRSLAQGSSLFPGGADPSGMPSLWRQPTPMATPGPGQQLNAQNSNFLLQLLTGPLAGSPLINRILGPALMSGGFNALGALSGFGQEANQLQAKGAGAVINAGMGGLDLGRGINDLAGQAVGGGLGNLLGAFSNAARTATGARDQLATGAVGAAMQGANTASRVGQSIAQAPDNMRQEAVNRFMNAGAQGLGALSSAGQFLGGLLPMPPPGPGSPMPGASIANAPQQMADMMRQEYQKRLAGAPQAPAAPAPAGGPTLPPQIQQILDAASGVPGMIGGAVQNLINPGSSGGSGASGPPGGPMPGAGMLGLPAQAQQQMRDRYAQMETQARGRMSPTADASSLGGSSIPPWLQALAGLAGPAITAGAAAIPAGVNAVSNLISPPSGGSGVGGGAMAAPSAPFSPMAPYAEALRNAQSMAQGATNVDPAMAQRFADARRSMGPFGNGGLLGAVPPIANFAGDAAKGYASGFGQLGEAALGVGDNLARSGGNALDSLIGLRPGTAYGVGSNAVSAVADPFINAGQNLLGIGQKTATNLGQTGQNVANLASDTVGSLGLPGSGVAQPPVTPSSQGMPFSQALSNFQGFPQVMSDRLVAGTQPFVQAAAGSQVDTSQAGDGSPQWLQSILGAIAAGAMAVPAGVQMISNFVEGKKASAPQTTAKSEQAMTGPMTQSATPPETPKKSGGLPGASSALASANQIATEVNQLKSTMAGQNATAPAASGGGAATGGGATAAPAGAAPSLGAVNNVASSMRSGAGTSSWSDEDWHNITRATGAEMGKLEGEQWLVNFAAEHSGNLPWQEGPFQDPFNNLLDHLFAKAESMGAVASRNRNYSAPEVYGNRYMDPGVTPDFWQDAYYSRYAGPAYAPGMGIVRNNQPLYPGQIPQQQWPTMRLLTGDNSNLLRPVYNPMPAMHPELWQQTVANMPGSGEGNPMMAFGNLMNSYRGGYLPSWPLQYGGY